MLHLIRAAALGMALAVTLVACGDNPITRKAETPQQQVFALKLRYEAALKGAVTYEGLKRCKAGQKPISCSSPKVVDIIRKSDKLVFASLDYAEKVVRDPAASESIIKAAINQAGSAVGNFVGIVTELAVSQ